MNKKIFLGLFMSCTLFFNTNSLAFANSEKTDITSNEIKLKSFEKIDYKLNYYSLSSNLQSNPTQYEVSGVFWGAGIGAVSGIFLGALADAGNSGSIAPINIGTPLGFIAGLVIGGVIGAVFDAGKNSVKK